MAKKSTASTTKKNSMTKKGSGLSSSLTPTDKERKAAIRSVEREMKKHGFKTVDEYIDYIDSKRGY